jgi:hypothetical protein
MQLSTQTPVPDDADDATTTVDGSSVGRTAGGSNGAGAGVGGKGLGAGAGAGVGWWHLCFGFGAGAGAA